MSHPKRYRHLLASFAITTVFSVSGLASALPPPAPIEAPAGDANLRKHIAEMYLKMSECLTKSARSLQECQIEVMKACPVAKELGFCPVMDGIKSMKSKTNKAP